MTPDEPAEVVAAGYDRLAGRWDDWAAAIWPPLREDYVARLLDLLPPGADVLELGCGTGEPVARLIAATEACKGLT